MLRSLGAMTPAARLAASADLLDRILAGEPAERVLTRWARMSRHAGSGDRAAIRDIVYSALRRRRSAAWVGGSETGRGLVLGLLRIEGTDPRPLMTGMGHALPPPAPGEEGLPLAEAPRAVRLDLPDWLLPRFERSLGPATDAVCESLRHRAPVFLRVNSRRGTRDQAREALRRDDIGTEAHPTVPTALIVISGARRVDRSEAYRSGLVELQDASSQEAVLRLPLHDGMRVLDLCAGGGGKTLAMGARARLHLHAHDIDPGRMADLPARAARAGLAVRPCADPAAAAPYDLVLVDAPCSGSGTWRRTPEAKWRLSEERLSALTALQDDLLHQAADLVAEGGILAFATCSILQEEGDERVAAFLARHPGWSVRDRLDLRPDAHHDGFFQAILQRIRNNPGLISPRSVSDLA